MLLLLLLPALLLQAQDALPAAATTSTDSSSQQAGLSRGAVSGGDGPHHPAHSIPADRHDDNADAYSNSTAAAAEEAVTETTADADAEQMLPQIPSYIRTTAMFFCIVIMLLGVVGNVMVSAPN